jgi:hypothetical protein
MITSPADERFITDASLEGHIAADTILVRAKAWGAAPIKSAVATFEGQTVQLSLITKTNVWQGKLIPGDLPDGV